MYGDWRQEPRSEDGRRPDSAGRRRYGGAQHDEGSTDPGTGRHGGTGTPPPRAYRSPVFESSPADQRTPDAGGDPSAPGHSRRATPARDAKGRVIPAGRKRKVLKWTALSVAGILVAVIGVGAYVYIHLNGNINTAALLPPGASQAAEVPNQFGQTPLNILMIGSDTRSTAADCHLGGACQASPPHADVEIVVHLAADRSNMTVVSIPRDTIVPLSSCAQADGSENLVNSALNFGPACQVEEVHELTGLTIDDFIEVDMAGVVALTNAVGGVPVCVQNNIYDNDSHLKLPAGVSYVQGLTALEWVRTRHAFPNEVYREEAQHLFLSALVRKLKANASLTHITTLYSVADAATKALTVSPALGSVTSLLSLGQELGKVPTSRITLLSAPTVPYSGPVADWSQQLQFDEPAANDVFAALKADRPYTAAPTPPTPAPKTGGPKPTTAPAAGSGGYPGNPGAVNKAGVGVSVQNGTAVPGRAGAIRTALVGAGFSGSLVTAASTSSTSATAIYYPPSRADSASAVASALGIPATAMHLSNGYSTVTVVIGADWTSGATFGSASAAAPPASSAPTAVASSPPAASLLTNGSDSKTCMPVQPAYRW
jgi:LCP family protein required for cell wall assembly